MNQSRTAAPDRESTFLGRLMHRGDTPQEPGARTVTIGPGAKVLGYIEADALVVEGALDAPTASMDIAEVRVVGQGRIHVQQLSCARLRLEGGQFTAERLDARTLRVDAGSVLNVRAVKTGPPAAAPPSALTPAPVTA